jgi:hypothetical protein
MRLRKPYSALWKAQVCFAGNITRILHRTIQAM